MTEKNIFRKKLRILLEKHNMRQKVLAEKLGITPAYLSELLSGKKKNPNEILLQLICSEFSVGRDWLFSDQEPESQQTSLPLPPPTDPDIKELLRQLTETQRIIAENQTTTNALLAQLLEKPTTSTIFRAGAKLPVKKK